MGHASTRLGAYCLLHIKSPAYQALNSTTERTAPHGKRNNPAATGGGDIRAAYGADDVSLIEGGGAAGGLAGGLVALGGKLIPGFDMVADELNLSDRIKNADLVITGEGQLDHTSYEGKVVGGVVDNCQHFKTTVAAIVGMCEFDAELDAEVVRPKPLISLTEKFGHDKAMNEPLWCIEHAALELLQQIWPQ